MSKSLTYIDLMNRFWEVYTIKPLAHIDCVLYFYLLKECNNRRWFNPFELQTRHLCMALELSRKTIAQARNRLKQRNLIDFYEATGGRATIYVITGVKCSNEELISQERVSQRVTERVSLGKREGNRIGNALVTRSEHEGNAKPLSTLYNKEKRDKTIEEDIHIQGACGALGVCQGDEKSSASFSGAAPAAGPLEAAKRPDHEVAAARRHGAEVPPPPSPEEIAAYFASHASSGGLDSPGSAAAEFFDYFEAVGWRDRHGRAIVNWRARANIWILQAVERRKNSAASPPGAANKTDNHKINNTDTYNTHTYNTHSYEHRQYSGCHNGIGIPVRGKITPAYGLARPDDDGEDAFYGRRVRSVSPFQGDAADGSGG